MDRLKPWRPLLDGDLAARANEAAQAIADDLHDPPSASDQVDLSRLRRDIDETCLARGRAGLAMFYGFKSLQEDSDDDRTAAIGHLDEAFDRVASLHMSTSLFVGFSGVAWAAQLLEDELLRSGGDPNEDIDEALVGFVDAAPVNNDYDLISGLVGVGVYCLERIGRPAAAKTLELIVARLEDTAQTTPQGAAWFTSPEMMPAATREEFADGFYNVGVAHGIAGIVAFLGRVLAAGVALRTTRALLAGAAEWLLAQRIPDDPRSVFPAVVVAGRPPEPSRTAWCYGDPGVAVALLIAAGAADEARWGREAVQLARTVARRPVELCGVNDAGLCHGAAGIAHVLNRISVATRDEEVAHAARSWFEQTLDMRRPGTGVGGYQTWRAGRGQDSGWIDHPGLLAGAAGIGLALLGATGSVEPSWDRCLLMSDRARDPRP